MGLTRINNQALTDVTSAGLPTKSGSVIQVKHALSTTQMNAFTSDTWVDATGFSVTITPTSASSKFYITASAGSLNSNNNYIGCLLYTSPSPRDGLLSRMPSSA